MTPLLPGRDGERSPPSTPGDPWRDHPSELVKHLAVALTRYVRHLRDGGLLVPPELDELTVLLVRCARTFPGAAQVDGAELAPQQGALAGRLLVTKAEAAEYLHVSVRPVERLVLAGKLPLLHIERASRLRLADVKAYFDSL